MPKVAILAKMSAQPGKRDALVEALKPMIEAVGDEPGTEVYVLHTANDEPDVVWFYELYTDQDSLTAHAGSEAMKQLGGSLRDLLAGRPELIMLGPAAAKGVAL
ncbi:MAG: hypothetical protein QOG64_497 [Acidimicrobiaceae bacterium]|nr:hypothetical protein [Acidimicrobiaceae bacterium]